MYAVEKRCTTFVASWSKQFLGIDDTANGVVCSVCLGGGGGGGGGGGVQNADWTGW